ncbi:hypothetical protein [Gordonia amicalis]|uniref:hypothetical protein n=1 Tax=Gordonia amicalis TaxID=89053 RepID=UPI001267E1B0|nr:hypothetical protein [Gordonia amicalis]
MTARSIRRHIDSLRGVLTDSESAELDRLLQKHDRATALAVHADSAVQTVAQTVTDSLPADAGEADMIEAAAKVPTPASLKLVADRVARASEREARNLVAGKRANLVQMFNAEFDAIRKEAAKVLPAVLPLESASDAIRAGKSKEWARVEDLYAEHQALRREADSLRSDSLLPAYKGHDGYGTWKHPEPAPRYSELPEFRKFADDLRRESYVPADQAEVDRVRAADQEAARVG